MRFTKAISSLLLTGAALFGSLSNAQAAQYNIHGGICHAQNASQNADITYNTTGVQNTSTASRAVLCPVVRNPSASADENYLIFGNVATGKVINCMALSFGSDGKFLGAQSADLIGSATSNNPIASIAFTRTQFTNFSTTALSCTLPASQGGSLRGILVTK